MKHSLSSLIPGFHSFYPLSILFLILSACSKDSSEPEVMNTTTNLVKVEHLVDYGNEGKASDLVVQYSVKDPGDLSEVWLFIAPDESFVKMNSTTLGQLSANQYQSIPISTSITQVSPSNLLLDTEGNQIQNDIPYKLGFATVKGEMMISREMVRLSFELKDQHYLTGSYLGLWNDERYTDYEVSIEIASIGSAFGGPVYLNHSFMPAYGGNDDGDVLFSIEGELLQDFIWTDFLNEFMGGCSGEWKGEGKIENWGQTILLQLAGENCLYSSSNAKVVLNRSL